jgi:hypothetical protein
MMKTILILAALSAAPVASAETCPTQAPPAVEPAAVDALQKMGAFLRNQKSFSIRTYTSTDYVLDSGEKVRQSMRGEIHVSRPDHLRAKLVGDRKEREYFYDGRTFTIFSPKLGYYGTVEAPPTILGLADHLQSNYGLELPVVDLFRWGTEPGASAQELTSAKFIGATTIEGVAVDQYAFRQQGIDWQLWIQRGAQPLPRRLVITTTDDPALPEHEVNMTWRLDARLDNRMFTFVPPKDAAKISMVDIETQRAQDRTTRQATRGIRKPDEG